MSDGRPRTFCRYTATITYRSGKLQTLTELEPVRFADVFATAGEYIDEQCFNRALRTTGDDWPVNIELRVHTFETEATE